MIQVTFVLACDGCKEVGLQPLKARDQEQAMLIARDHGWGYKSKPLGWYCPRCTVKKKAGGEQFTFDNDQYEIPNE